MATPFDEQEKIRIRSKLQESARACLSKYGTKKTTVDQLTAMSGISKGSFYKFYPSKEVLFFTVLEDYQKTLMEHMIEQFSQMETVTPEQFTQAIYGLYQEVRQSFIMTIIELREFDYLMRKLPEALILNHHSLDDLMARELFKYIKINKEINIEVATAALRAIFMTMLHVTEIGEKPYDQALELLISGVAGQLLGGEAKDG